MARAIVGANWGDEGKGKITDMLAQESDIVIRFQGGSNAGHTVVADGITHKLRKQRWTYNYQQLWKICNAPSSIRRVLTAHCKYHWKWCCTEHSVFYKGVKQLN